MGANPMRKDLFIEVDCLVSDGNNDGDLNDPVDHSHCPREAAIRDVVQAFANAPVGNPDGTTGIQLHIDTGALYGSGVVTPVPGVGGVTVELSDGEEAISIDCQVEWLFGLAGRPLRVDVLGGYHARPPTELESRRAVPFSRGGTNRLVQQVLEMRADPLEAVGAQVGQVVGDHVDAYLLGHRSRYRREHR